MRIRFGDRYPDIEGNVSIPSLAGLKLGRDVQFRNDSEIVLDAPAPDGAGTASITLGNRVRVGRRVHLSAFPGSAITVGDDTSFQAGCVIIGDVAIGSNCLFSLYVFISSGNHFSELRPDWLIRDQDRLARETPDFAGERSAPVIVEDDCWLGWGAIIKRGTYVGKGAVIGSYSVVTTDVPPYSVQAGAPSRELRKRFDFQPPATVCASNESHHPYFYSGFMLRKEDLIGAPTTSAIRLQGSRGRVVLAAGNHTSLFLDGSLETGVASVQCKLYWNRRPILSTLITDHEFELRVPVPHDAQSEAAREKLPSPLREFNELTIEIGGVSLSPPHPAIEAAVSRSIGAIDSNSYLQVRRCSCDAGA